MATFPKEEILKALGINLRLFFPHLTNHFMCPVCLRIFDIQRDQKQITKAHLIPQAAGGKNATLLCKQCNNRFGSKQDKWFGERVRLYKENKHLFQSKLRERRYEVDGIPVNGDWVMTDEGDFTFLIDPIRNSPETIKRLEKKFAVNPPRLNITMPIPLAKEQRLTSVGFLTMAYLYWFTFFGYSWIMQRHLDAVRKQISDPDGLVINERCFTKFMNNGKSFELPHFCAAMIADITCACLLYQNVGVFFPTPHSPVAYQQLARFSGDDLQTSVEIKFFNLDAFYLGSIVSISHHNKLVVLPDAMPDLIDTGTPSIHILFTNDKGPEPTILQPISAENATRLKSSGKPVRTTSIDHRKEISRVPKLFLP